MPFRFLLLLGVLAALLVPSSALAAEPGLNINGGAASGVAENFDQLSDTGAKWARHFLYWDNMDESGLREFDRIVAEEDRRGVKTLLTVAGTGGQPPADHQRYATLWWRFAPGHRNSATSGSPVPRSPRSRVRQLVT